MRAAVSQTQDEQLEEYNTMRIENTLQVRPEVRKPVYQTSSSHSFGQMLIERTKDRYVSSAQSLRTEDTDRKSVV